MRVVWIGFVAWWMIQAGERAPVQGGSTTGKDDVALKSLQERGLVRYGTHLTLRAENELIRRIKEIQPVQKALQTATKEFRAAESRVSELQQQRRQLLERRIALNRDLQNAKTAAENNQIVAAINGATDKVQLIEAEIRSMDQTLEKRRDQLAAARSDYLRLTVELRALADKIEAEYAKLAADPQSASDLQRLGGEDGKEYRIEPSRAYVAAVRQLEKYESAVASDSIPLEQRFGVYRVEVELNEKLTVSMIFDTGAGYVALPAAVAVQLGLRPSDADPNVTVVIADGSRVQAKAMRLKSMRIGSCVAEDVDCLIMPETLPNAQTVLGGTFLRNFSYRIDPETHRLTLAKIDVGVPGRDAPAAKKSRPAKSKSGRD